MRKSKHRPNAKGRDGERTGNAGRVLILKRSLVQSPQFSALSLAGRALLLELHAMHNGTNRECVFLSVRDAADRLGLSCLKAVSAAFDELANLGFITVTIGSSFRQKADGKSRARSFRLEWIDNNGRCLSNQGLPPLEFRTLAPSQKRRVEKRSRALARYLKGYITGEFSVDDTIELSARKQFAVEQSSTLRCENSANRPDPLVEVVPLEVKAP